MGSGPVYEETPKGEFPGTFSFVTSLPDESERWQILRNMAESIAREQGVITPIDRVEWYGSDPWDRLVFAKLPNGRVFEFRLVRQRESFCEADRFSDWHNLEDLPRRHDYIEYEAKIIPLRLEAGE